MAYLGNAPVVGDSTNSFRLLDDIASFTLTFDATDTAVVSIANDTLSFTNHRFVNGQKVTYTDGGGTAIGGLSDGTSYFIIKVDQNTIKLATSASNAASSTAINLTSGAAGGSHTLNVKFDGVNTKFKATFNNGKKAKISRAAQLSLSINGVVQQPQDSSSPSVGYGVEADSTIVFSTAPVATDVVFGSFIGEVAASFDLEDNTVDNFTGDGSTTIFNLSKEVPSSQDVLVTIDGVTQYPSDGSTTRAYSVIDQALTFVSAPADGTAIQARHIGFAGATTSAVTGFYGRTGNAALISTDNISVNNITAAGNVTVAGVLTYEDVTNVDSVGLITARSGISVSGGDIKVGSATTLSQDNIFTTGIITATSYYGDGSNLSNITSTTINNNADNRLITGSGTANTLEGEANITFDGTNLDLGDSKKIRLGASQDLELYHNGSDSFVAHVLGSGHMRVAGDSLKLMSNTSDENYLVATKDGAVELYYDNSKKIETLTNGIKVHGNIFMDDNDEIRLGDSGDFQLFHNSSTGEARIFNSNAAGINIITDLFNVKNNANNETLLKATNGGAVELYYDNSKKLETTTNGITVGSVTIDSAFNNIGLPDNGQLRCGAGEDLRIYHSSDVNYISGEVDGKDIYLRGRRDVYLQCGNNSSGYRTFIYADNNGTTRLYHPASNDEKFRTQSDGVRIEDGGRLYFQNGSENASSAIYNGAGSGSSDLQFRTNGTHRATLNSDGHFEPALNNTYDLGTTSYRWRNIYTNDLNLSNKGSTNSVDNTWGDYTIQEGESDLFLINNRSGKKFKFNLTEVS